MRAVAEFIMRGRAQALLVAVPSAGTAMFFWVGAAAVGLVTLRKGTYEGAIVCLWSLLPAAVMAWLSQPLPLMVVLSTYLLAVLLRNLASWPVALSVAALAGALFAALLLFGLSDYFENFLQQYMQIFGELEKELARRNPGRSPLLPKLEAAQMAGMFGFYATLFSVISLIIARYWQALLYNPGGFRVEFHALRMPKQMLLPLALMAALCLSSENISAWAWIFLLPLLIAGIALVHSVAARKQLSKVALTAFYVMLILANPVKLLVCAAAIVDSWLNVRARLT